MPNPTLSDTLTEADDGILRPDWFARYGDNYLVVADSQYDGIHIVDVSNPDSIHVVGSITSSVMNQATGVAIYGDFAVVRALHYLAIVDISDPANPFMAGSEYDTTWLGGEGPVAVIGNHAMVGMYTNSGGTFYYRYSIYDLSTPSNPARVDEVYDPQRPRDIVVFGDYAVTANNAEDSVAVYNLSNPANVGNAIGKVTDATRLNNVYRLAKYGDNYVVAIASNYLTVVDVSDKSDPVIVGQVTDSDFGTNRATVSVSRDYAVVSAFITGDQTRDDLVVKLFDLSNVVSPQAVTSYEVVADDSSLQASYSDDNYLYIASRDAANDGLIYQVFLDLNAAPNAPGALAPYGDFIDRTTAQRFSWSFSDPDAGDAQSAYDLRYREQGTSTWVEVSGGAAEYHDFAGGTFTDGDWEWQVRTTDNGGLTSPWSSTGTFTAGSPPPGPSISSPANGGTVSTGSFSVEWTAPEQDAYEVRRIADAAGSPDTGTVYFTTGTVSSTSRTRSLTFETNNRDEHIQVRVRKDGIWSSWASVRVSVSYTVPATPTLTAASDSPVDGAVRIAHSHPAPTGDEPTVISVDLWRRETSDSSTEERIVAGASPSSPIDVYSSRSGVSYEFRIRANGDNGTSSWSAWTG